MVSHPAHLRPAVHWIKAQFAGKGGLVGDVFQTYPRAYHTAHLDDGIMEAITTNWGNDGIQSDMLGPALAGTDDVSGVPTPLKRILLSDQFLWVGAAIAIDFSPLQNQINALAAQQLADQAAFTNFSTAITAELAADEAQIAANVAAIAALQDALTAANAVIADLQHQITVLAQTGRYNPSAEALLRGTGSLVATLRMRAFIAPTVLMGSGNLIADPFIGRPISADFAGEGGLIAYLSGPGYLSPRLMTGVGGLTANLGVGKYIDPPDFAGVGSLTAQMALAARLAPSTMAGTGSVTADLFGPVQFLLAQILTGKGSLTANLAKDLSGAVLSGAGSLNASPVLRMSLAPVPMAGEGDVNVGETMLLALQPSPMAGAGAVSAALIANQVVAAAMAGVGGLTVDLTRLAGFTLWDIGSLFAGAGALQAKTQILMPVTPALLTGIGGFSANVFKAKFINANFAPRGGFTANVTQTSAFSAFDPAQKDTMVVLTNSNRTATASGAANTQGTVPGTKSNSTGKKYCEFKILTMTNNANTGGVGVLTSSFPLKTNTMIGTDGFSFAALLYAGIGYTIFSSGAAVTIFTNFPPAANDIIQIAFDLTSSPNKLYFGFNNTWNNNGSPGTFNAAAPDFSNIPGTYFPACTVDVDAATLKTSFLFNPGNATFAYTPPTGFSAWG